MLYFSFAFMIPQKAAGIKQKGGKFTAFLPHGHGAPARATPNQKGYS